MNNMRTGFKDNDPAHTNFQYLEDLSTAYWYSDVLFAAIELKLFFHMDRGASSPGALAGAAQCRKSHLLRLLRSMEGMALVTCHGNNWYNSQVSSLFLVPGKPDYMGDFFLYRKYMRPNWEKLTRKVSLEKDTMEKEIDYARRNDLYVAAMDTLVRQKAREIAGFIPREKINGTILDVGGGAGSMLRVIMKRTGASRAVLFDIPEVIASAERLYPGADDWNGIKKTSGDFRTHEFKNSFSLIVMSNFLHAYGPEEAKNLLSKAVTLLSESGVMLIHDYFPDRKAANPQKGGLYDLAMMLNTYNGVCHDTKSIVKWLGASGLHGPVITDLSTDSTVILAGKGNVSSGKSRDTWEDIAVASGFDRAVSIHSEEIITAPWVRHKCRFGCENFNRNLKCPPYTMSHKKTRELLDSYQRIFLVQGAPPGKAFHDHLLKLEKKAFLKGYHKAFVFGAGPCPVCPSCPDDEKCRFPQLARPSMEASGIDVYATVKNRGWPLEPVTEKGFYVKYIGLFLLE